MDVFYVCEGDVEVCDPKTWYQCLRVKRDHYVRDNEASKCNCPLQCRELIYEPTVSQSPLANSIGRVFAADDDRNRPVQEIISDRCIVEVPYVYLRSNESFMHGLRTVHAYAALRCAELVETFSVSTSSTSTSATQRSAAQRSAAQRSSAQRMCERAFRLYFPFQLQQNSRKLST